MGSIKGNLRGKYNGTKLVYGHGINDADYVTGCEYFVEGFTKRGSRWVCPYYYKWRNMLGRVYSKKYQSTRRNYEKVSVCKEWLLFSSFSKWVDEQPERDWKNLSLDKDFLSGKCKEYSPNTSVFIDAKVNNFIIDSGSIRGNCMLGVSFNRDGRERPYETSCNDPFKRGSNYIGGYKTELEAHLAWKTTKHKYALELADTQTDERIKEVLRNKYK